MHNEVKRFELTGVITSGKFMSARTALIRDVEDGMRDEGYVPVLDLMPQFTREYNEEEENFDFVLSVYGAYVGEEEAWRIAGMMNGLVVEKSTHRSR